MVGKCGGGQEGSSESLACMKTHRGSTEKRGRQSASPPPTPCSTGSELRKTGLTWQGKGWLKTHRGPHCCSRQPAETAASSWSPDSLELPSTHTLQHPEKEPHGIRLYHSCNIKMFSIILKLDSLLKAHPDLSNQPQQMLILDTLPSFHHTHRWLQHQDAG